MKHTKRIGYVYAPGNILHTAKVQILRQSSKTGSYAVEILENRGAYAVGSRITLSAYEFRTKKPE
mgnify:CR=1 FL=1